MTLSELKFAESDFEGQDIASLDDRPKISAAELKKRFDNIGKALLALGAFNKLVDALLDGEASRDIQVELDGEIKSLVEVLQGLEDDKAEADLANVADEVLKQRVEAVGITGSGGAEGLPEIGEGDDGKVVAVNGDEYALKKIAMLCTEVSNTSGGTTLYIESGM